MPNNIVAKIIKSIKNVRLKAFEKRLPKGKTVEHAINEEIENLKKYMIFLENYIKSIFETEEFVEEKIELITTTTKQFLKKEYLAKELWILRFAFLHLWFFDIKPAKDQNELTENIKLITRAFQNIANRNEKSDYLPWLTKGLSEYINVNALQYSDLRNLESNFTEKVAEKVALIAFESTEGRLAGEQYDFVVELIQTTIEDDKKCFSL
ncbi:hypothetical protein KKG24_01975 [Patescibacteria group bacterium]|nr:hypothetical protein [Patescibacteria group bacterium]